VAVLVVIKNFLPRGFPSLAIRDPFPILIRLRRHRMERDIGQTNAVLFTL
jgi:hypothetical protein